MPRQIALLRGINIGANKRVPMPRLRELLTEHGYEDVKTYVASGNVVLTSRSSPRKLEKELEKLIEDEWGFDVAVIVRTRDELADVVEREPFGKIVDDPKFLQVSFLSGKPDAENAKKINDACVRARAGRHRRPRDLRVAPRRDRALGSREAPRDQEARRHRHRAQLAHRAGAARARRPGGVAQPFTARWYARRNSSHLWRRAKRRSL